VGRLDEEELILSRVRAVGAGGQRFVLVTGEPGIGKTRLALEVASMVTGAAILVAVTGNDATRSAVVGIAELLAEESSGLDDDELRLCLGRWPEELAAVVPALARRFPDLVGRSGGPDALRADRVRASIVSWLVALSHRAPVVLMIDDVQRAGPALFQFLRELSDRGGHKRIVVLATASPQVPNRWSKLEHLIDDAIARGELDRIELAGLREESVTELFLQLRVPNAIARARDLWRVTGGHPFFLGELLREAAWDVSAVPASVREFVRRRLGALDAGARVSVEAASAFVTAFDVSLLAEVAEVSDAIVATHIDRAIEAGILREVQARSFTFVHELTRRAVMESVEETRRAMLHRRVAGALELRGANVELLATHWSRAVGADARAKAFGYASTAGTNALRDVDPDAATRWFEVAVFASDGDDKAWAMRLLTEAYHQAGDESSSDALQEGVELAFQ
jgi:predicted ATPase